MFKNFMRPFFSLDDWIVSKCQKFTNWTQETFGLTKFFWEKLSCFLGWTSMSVAFTISYLHEQSFLVNLTATIVIGVACVLVMTILMVMIISAEKSFLRDQSLVDTSLGDKTGKVIVATITAPVNSIMALVLGVLTAEADLLLMSVGFMAIGMQWHFADCVPKPPSKSKFIKWLTKMIMKMASNNSPLPQPS